MNEREEYIDKVCKNVSDNLKRQAEEEKMSEKEKFLNAFKKYKNDLESSLAALNESLEIQNKTIDIIDEYIENHKNINDKLCCGICQDVDTKREIVEQIKKNINIIREKLIHIDSVEEFMIENYERFVEVNFVFDNCLKFNGEYTNKINSL